MASIGIHHGRVATLSALLLAVGTYALAQSATMPQYPGPTTLSAGPGPDARLEDDVAFAIETHDVLRRYDIDVEVSDLVVTLSGDVASEEQRQMAVDAAGAFEEAVRVDNTIDVDPDADLTLAYRIERGLSRAGEELTDAWITTKVTWFLTNAARLEGSDIDVDTTDRAVTLSGTVPSEAARARALDLARMTDGAGPVRDHLLVVPPRN